MGKKKANNKGKKNVEKSTPAQNNASSKKKTKLVDTPPKEEVPVEEPTSQIVEEASSLSQQEVNKDNDLDTKENDEWFDKPNDSLHKSVPKDSDDGDKAVAPADKLKEKSQDLSTDNANGATSEEPKKEDKASDDCEGESSKRSNNEIKDEKEFKDHDRSKEHQSSRKKDQDDKNKHSRSNLDKNKSSYKDEDVSRSEKEGSCPRRNRPNKDYGNQSKGDLYKANQNQSNSSSWGGSRNRGSSPTKRQGSHLNDPPKTRNTRWDSSPIRNYQNNVEDYEYREFMGNSHKLPIKYIRVREIEGDLFAMSKEYSLAHCVAEDMNMGSGIAVQFSQQFKRRDELYHQRQRQGGLAILEDNPRYIYYLVTKRLSTGKPTYYTFWCSLKKLQQHIQTNDVKKLAIPRIGCGLDRLEWSTVKAMIEIIFENTDVEITVCNFQQNYGKTKQKLKQKSDTDKKGKQPKIDEQEEDLSTPAAPSKTFKKCLVKNVEKPAVQIEQETAIVYFGSEDCDVTEEIESLNTKFKTVRRDYTTSKTKIGDVVQTWSNDNLYALYGCIVKKQKDDLFDYLSFQKCINRLKSLNRKENMFYYVAFQAFVDKSDDLMLNKIVNMLRYSLIGVHIYVCWPRHLAHLMPRDYLY